jgi:V8-like Glu-specific endopeptidase
LRTIVLIILNLFLSQCQSVSHDTSDFDNIFGNDDRRPWSELDETLRNRIGILYRGTSLCTATLVGENIILTNAHCVYESDGQEKSGTFCFYLNYQDLTKDPFVEGRSKVADETDREAEGLLDKVSKSKTCPKKSSKYRYDAYSKAIFLKAGTKTPSRHRSRDWALLQLQTPLGEANGFIPIVALDESDYTGTMVTLPGFSGDFKKKYGTGSFHKNCKIEYVRNELIRHSCDTLGGASGSPLLISRDNDYAIIGLHAAAEDSYCKGKERVDDKCRPGTPYRDEIANKAVFSRKFINEIP